jgi:hypothetical protein
MAQRLQIARTARTPSATTDWSVRRAAPRQVESVLRSAGSPLPHDVRSTMQSRLGHDFSGVRVHADGQAAEAAERVSARAFAVGPHIVFGRGEYRPGSADTNRLLAHELTHVVQQRGAAPGGELAVTEHSDAVEVEARQAESAAPGFAPVARYAHPLAVARDDKKPKESKLLAAFRAKFSAAAAKIDASEAALKLVNEADAAGAEFGGFAEDGPHKDTWAYTSGNKVYIPKASTDPVIAMNNFLFELNNAIRAPQIGKLAEEASKGTKGTLTGKTYAYKIVEQEVEGMLRLGEVWFQMKKAAPKENPAKYDADFYQAEYTAVKDKKKSKDDIIKDVLGRKYTDGVDKGKTVEQYYIERYTIISGGK